MGCAQWHNRFIHNVNYGTLIAKGPNNYTGGIVGVSYADNIWIHNLNVGTITLYPVRHPASSITCYAGGIVSSAGRNDRLTYNTNAGNIQVIGDKGSYVGGIAARIGGSNVCTHNVNVAFLNGTQLGGIVSEAYQQNTVSYNFNSGALVGGVDGDRIGGILGHGKESNIISYNANSGNIIGRKAAIGGIVSEVGKNNNLSYNVNTGELSVSQESLTNLISGIAFFIREHNMFHHNINTGAILVEPNSEVSPIPKDPSTERYNVVGGIICNLSDNLNKITHNINRGVIRVSQVKANNHIGGIIGDKSSFSRAVLTQNVYNSALISHVAMTEQQFQSDPEAYLDSDKPFIDVTDFSTLPNGYFGLTQDWVLTTKGPMLTWLLKDRALHLLQYFNHLKVIHVYHYLPLEMMLAIANALDDFSYLSMAHIQRIYHYAFIPVCGLVHHLSQPKCHWSKEDYLSYVLEGT